MELLLGNCLDRLKELKDNSVDAIVTDPPYGLSFMGKKWDYDVPSVDIWKECLRVLKPGGYLLSFAGTRTQHRMAVNIEDAGFEIRDMIAWVYGSGFPKSLNIGKAVDKRGGKSVGWFGKWLREWREEKNITQKEIAKLFPSKTGGLTGCVANWELGLNIPTNEQFNLICRTFNLPFENLEEAEREVVGKATVNGEEGTAGGYQNGIASLRGSDVSTQREIDITKGTSQWEGWGTALKPALEPITVARKPIEGTVAENCLKWGVGGINIDGCRVETEDYLQRDCKGFNSSTCYEHGGYGDKALKGLRGSTTGRFPANLIHDGSEEVVGLFPQTKSGGGNKNSVNNQEDSFLGTGFGGTGTKTDWKVDSGSAARFFMSCKYTPKDAIMNICEDSIYVNNVGNSLPIMSLIESVVNISSVLKSATPNLDLLNHYLNVLFVEKKSESIVIDFVAKLVAISEVPEGVLNQQELTVIQDFITSCKGCSQTQNPVSSVGKWEDTDITQIIINLLRLCGYVLLATEENTNSGKREVGVVNGEPKRFAYIPKASKRERNKGLEGFEKGCTHPTVKPLALMEYLVKLVSKEGHIVLDPFMGSGTTGMACKKLNREFIGIEMMEEYMEIAKCRIEGVEKESQLNML